MLFVDQPIGTGFSVAGGWWLVSVWHGVLVVGVEW